MLRILCSSLYYELLIEMFNILCYITVILNLCCQLIVFDLLNSLGIDSDWLGDASAESSSCRPHIVGMLMLHHYVRPPESVPLKSIIKQCIHLFAHMSLIVLYTQTGRETGASRDGQTRHLHYKEVLWN